MYDVLALASSGPTALHWLTAGSQQQKIFTKSSSPHCSGEVGSDRIGGKKKKENHADKEVMLVFLLNWPDWICDGVMFDVWCVMCDTGCHVISLSLGVLTHSYWSPSECTHCSPLLPSLYTISQTAALLYSPGWRLFLTQNIKTVLTVLTQTFIIQAQALPPSPSSHLLSGQQ